MRVNRPRATARAARRRGTRCSAHASAGAVALAVTAAVALATTGLQGAGAQSTDEPSVWDGVYSEGQAERGRKLYEASCARCHGDDLSGANARPLAGESFIRDWGGLKLDGVLTRARTMPPGGAGSLGEEGYVDIVAYVLSANDFPHGEGELTAARAGDILVYGEDGPDAVPNFAMVQVVGCLSREERTWFVTDGSEPIRTRDPEVSAGDILELTRAMPLGGNTFELMYVFPSPDPYEGHRVEAKGFLIRRDDAGATDAINVTAVASLSPACTP